MRDVIFLFQIPKLYRGGISFILDVYLKHTYLFNIFCYQISLINYHNKSIEKINNSKIRNLLYPIFELFHIRKTLQKKPNAILHIQTSRKWLLFKDLLLSFFIKLFCSNKIGFTIHFSEPQKMFYDVTLLKKIELYILRNKIDFIVILSQQTIDELSLWEIPQNKMHLLYTFHNINLPSFPYKKNDILQFLFVGSIDRRKGIIDLLKTLVNYNYPFTLHICGKIIDNSIEEIFNSLCVKLNSKVILHGFIEGKEKEQVFCQSDILILPSYGEGMPIVIMEAMACGCAIISTNVGAIPEVIKEDNGILINPGDQKALKESLIRFETDRELLKTIQHNNFEKSQLFDTRGNISSLCKIYDTL